MTNDTQNWRIDTDAGDYFLHQKKQLGMENRRPVIRQASDLVGPGISVNAVRVTNLNDDLALFNGFFSCIAATTNAPSANACVGWVSSDAEIGGVQMFTDLTTGLVYRRVFTRSLGDSSFITFGTWNAVN